MDFKNKIRPIIGVRRAGMAQLEQVQHASCHLAGAVGNLKPDYDAHHSLQI